MSLHRNQSPAISAIEPGRRPKRFNIYVDGAFAVAAGEKMIAELGLRVGLPIDAAKLLEITRSEETRRALESAGRLLQSRPRSSHEIKQRLAQRGFDECVVSSAMAALERIGLIDDSDFAQQWIDSRNRLRPKGVRSLQAELAQKGVDRERIDEALGAISSADELDLARKAAVSKISRAGIPREEPQRTAEYRRLAAFLQRRGFAWDTVKTILAEQFGSMDAE